MSTQIPVWQAVIVAFLTAGGTFWAQVVKSKQESGDKTIAAEYAYRDEFTKQLMESSKRVPELLERCENLINANAKLSGDKIIMDAKFSVLEGRVLALEEEKKSLEFRMTALLSMEGENINLKEENAKMFEVILASRSRISELEGMKDGK
jgi:hypothetical protein